MNNPLKKIVIVGGGTAGWLTAGILAAEHNAHRADGLEITLIESPDLKPIGVGEGTWPTMRDTIQSIGISEYDFISCCDVSFKQGSQFVGWCDDTSADSYYHPFVAPHGFGQSNLTKHWQQSKNSTSFAHTVSFQPHLCDYGCAPKQKQTPEYAAVANYAYHLNATKFAQLLQKHCTEKLKVKHIKDHVTGVNGNIDDNIQSISTKQHGNLTAELFVDCSGSSAILLAQHYKIPFINKKDVLFNDTALAVQVPYANANEKIASHTISTAHDAGWIWDIGLPTRRGVGCVYASDYMTDDAAEAQLRAYLSKTLPQNIIKEAKIRKLSFTPGYREKFWHKNCVAVGMASGFLEPLEASALALVELSAKMIAKELPAEQSIMPITAERFNRRFHYRWQRIIEFLKLHYVLSKRSAKYWQDNKATNTIPDRLQQLLALWQYQEPTFNDFTEIEEIFPAASYQYILYGMGFKTQVRATSRRIDNELLSEKLITENQQLCQKYLAGLPTNRELIDHIIHLQMNKKVC
ncbi:tryptophan 7-halogenase [Thalassotalea psychrophila]|uniref:Tryptophan 7-halogenase n=1 Tax=Thalassotalea psychrophila TaxID=3065647 RepID=A0ABY9TRU6_9GAMM|nr:tryptophan 7-halogenase [Colwelliaceae bacterium SQ149]